MDLSKAFDTISYSLLLAKLEAYVFSMTSLKLMQSYLCNRFQRTSASFSDWKEIETVVPQGSILGALLFNIFLNDIFYFINNGNICNDADDNALYSIGRSLNIVKQKLKINVLIMQKWFYENHMVLNPGKCYYFVLGNRSSSDTINGTKLASSSYEKLLSNLIDRDLSFDKHIKTLYRKAGQKLNALARISNYFTHDQKRLLLNSIIKSQFSYCPLIWMFCSRPLNNLSIEFTNVL